MLTGTLLLFVCTFIVMYWLRYTCQLIIRAHASKDYARAVAEANGLSFLEHRKKLASQKREGLDVVERSLQRDYRLVCSLLRHTAGFGRSGGTLQLVLLRADYVLMGCFYRLTRRCSEQLARQALSEMSLVVRALAHSMGERAAAARA